MLNVFLVPGSVLGVLYMFLKFNSHDNLPGSNYCLIGEEIKSSERLRSFTISQSSYVCRAEIQNYV